MKKTNSQLTSAPRIASLSLEEIRALRRGSKGRVRSRAMPALVASPRDDRAPLAHAQEGLWFLEQLGLVGSAYNSSKRIEITGALNPVALEQSFLAIIRRHEILRTRFQAVAGRPVQRVDHEANFQLRVHDLSKSPPPARSQAIASIETAATQGRFDLASGPLLRAELVRFSEREHWLLITMHHIVTDGWSWGLLKEELERWYEHYANGDAASLAELPVQYGDYAIWQRAWLASGVLDEQLKYWKARLAGAPTHLELPTDRPRPAEESHKGAEVCFELSGELAVKARALAMRTGSTLFMVCLAVYQLLLSRWSGQQDIVVGSPLAGRRPREVEGLIGLFVNTVALRTELALEQSFEALLLQVRNTALDAYAHQDLPFEVLVKELRPERDLARQPIYQVSLVVARQEDRRGALLGPAWAWSDTECVVTHFDLTLNVEESRDRLACTFIYATDLFDSATIERMARQFDVLFASAVGDADRPLYQMPALGHDERRRLLYEEMAPVSARRNDRCVHEAFSEQARANPDAIALVKAGSALSYIELERRSNQLAHYLRASGVGPDVIVAVCLERSIELVIAIVAVLKAGGAYLPLDPAHPSARLHHVLRESGSMQLLTDGAGAQRLSGVAARVIDLDHIAPALGHYPMTPPAVAVSPRNLAYVIYTSGSTGTPKGVMVEHAGLSHYLQWAMSVYDPKAGSAIPVSSPLAFDATATSLYCALLSGRTAVLVEDEHELEELEQLLQGPTCLSLIKVSPTHLQALGPRLRSSKQRATLHAMVVGGEALPATTVCQWRTMFPQVRIFNQYGPTETVIACSVHEVPAGADFSGVLPIGKPQGDIRLYVLDAYLQLLPIGARGELYIAGAQVSRGYLNQPGLTAERFVPDPFGEPGGRLYRSGDLVRYLPGGELEFLGRCDQQVKLRGYRVELSEIETQLRLHPHVQEAVVLMREDVPGDQRLIAYVTPAASSVDALRSHLRGALPAYMLPAAFVMLDAMPRTPNGKLDKRALPLPAMDAYVSSPSQPPTGQTQQALAAIWQDLLRIERVGRADNFFALGGHSLIGIQLIEKIGEAFGVRLPVIAIFKYPTVEQMAEAVEALCLPEHASHIASAQPMEQGAI